MTRKNVEDFFETTIPRGSRNNHNQVLYDSMPKTIYIKCV